MSGIVRSSFTPPLKSRVWLIALLTSAHHRIERRQRAAQRRRRRIREVHAPDDVVLELRPVREAESSRPGVVVGVAVEAEHHADVPSPRRIVAGDLRERVQTHRRHAQCPRLPRSDLAAGGGLTVALRQRSRVVHVVGERRLEMLIVHAGADPELVGDLVGHRRVDVDRLHFGLERLIAAEPAVVVIRLEAEGHIDADPDVDLVGEGHRPVEVRHESRAAGVAARAAQRLQRRCLRVRIPELGRRDDHMQRALHLRQIEPRETGGIEPDGVRVLGGGPGAGKGVAEPHHILLGERERGTVRLRCAERERDAGNGRGNRGATEGCRHGLALLVSSYGGATAGSSRTRKWVVVLHSVRAPRIVAFRKARSTIHPGAGRRTVGGPGLRRLWRRCCFWAKEAVA